MREDITIEGPKSLLDAIKVECNLVHTDIPQNCGIYLRLDTLISNGVQCTSLRGDIHYKLPNDWNEVIYCIKENLIVLKEARKLKLM